MKTNKHSQRPSHSYFFLYGYSLGEFGFTFFLMFIAYHLMYYMTNVLNMPMGLAAVIYTALQWFEGITMLAAGVLVDNIRLKWGQYRPWMVIGSVICGVFTVLVFTNFHLSAGMNAFLFTVFYFIAYSGYNLMWVAYRAMVGPLSRCPQDNVSLATTASQMGSVAGLLFSFFGTKLLNSTDNIQTGYTISAVIYGVVIVGGMVLTSIITRPFDNASTQAVRLKAHKAGWRDKLRCLNRPMIVFCLAVTFRESVSTLLPTLLVYYFNYALGRSDLLSVYLTIITLTPVFGIFIGREVANRFGKKNMFFVSCCVAAAALLLVNVVGNHVILFMILMGLYSFCCIFSGNMLTAFMNEIADYNECMHGVYARSFAMSLSGVAIRTAAIIGGGLASFGLLMVGFDAANGVIPATFPQDITRLMSFSSAAVIMVSALIITFYPLNQKVMDQVYSKRAAELGEQKGDH